MVFEIILLFLLVFGLCVIGYRGAVHEFQILQKEYDSDLQWTEQLSERLPLVIRNLPSSSTGYWTQSRTHMKHWPVHVTDAKKARLRTTWNKWIPNPENTLTNGAELARYAKLEKAMEHWMDHRRWFWIPFVQPVASVLNTNQCVGIQKTTAEATLIVSTDGIPLEIWLTHEEGIPGHLVEEMVGKDPWIQTTNEIPGISDVKYIEVKLRSNNAMVLPSHWWYAIRPAEEGVSWYWTSEFHSPVSFLATKLKGSLN